MTSEANPDLRQQALAALLLADARQKCHQVAAIDAAGALNRHALLSEPAPLPAAAGRPEKPALVPPSALKTRSVHTTEGRAALLHALAHIEFNAINLALDVIWRFNAMPRAFYLDWLGVAREEALHFGLLRDRLQALGYDYGDFPAHNGLWEMAAKTSGDLLARLALVPRTLEARGLDAAPPIRQKLASAGDAQSAAVLDIILNDEIGHVAIGNHWYRYVCQARGLDPEHAYGALAQRYDAPRARGPFNLEARQKAGFTPGELSRLTQAMPRSAS